MDIRWFATDRDQVIIALLIAMAAVLAAELIYLFAKKRRRRKEMSLFRSRETAEEPLADKAHNSVMTAESISLSLSRQGADTSEADGLISEARRALAMKDYARAIERAEAAKISLLRAKRELEEAPAEPAPSIDLVEEQAELSRPAQPVKRDSMPTNYMQSKFMLATAGDLLEKRGISSGEAYDLYSRGQALFDAEDYTGALSCATRASRMLDSESIALIGGEPPAAEEVIEVTVCPYCDCEIAEDDAFCKECGKGLAAPAECPGCGMEIGPADKFCRKCGTKLK